MSQAENKMEAATEKQKKLLSKFDGKMKHWLKGEGDAEGITSYYDEFAQEYDDFRGDYVAPRIMAGYMKPHLDKMSELSRIMDVGAGTGYMGTELRAILPKEVEIDALEPSREMLNIAQKENVYNNCYVEFMNGLNSTTIHNETYDVTCCAGGFIPGHIPMDGIQEMIRITKTGGLIAIIIRQMYIDQYAGYKDWYPTVERLQKDGIWTRIENLNNLPYHGHHIGCLFIYEKL